MSLVVGDDDVGDDDVGDDDVGDNDVDVLQIIGPLLPRYRALFFSTAWLPQLSAFWTRCQICSDPANWPLQGCAVNAVL